MHFGGKGLNFYTRATSKQQCFPKPLVWFFDLVLGSWWCDLVPLSIGITHGSIYLACLEATGQTGYHFTSVLGNHNPSPMPFGGQGAPLPNQVDCWHLSLSAVPALLLGRVRHLPRAADAKSGGSSGSTFGGGLKLELLRGPLHNQQRGLGNQCYHLQWGCSTTDGCIFLTTAFQILIKIVVLHYHT